MLTSEEIADHAAGGKLNSKRLVGDWTFDKAEDGAYENVAADGLAAKVVGGVQHVADGDGGFIRLDGNGYLEVAPDPRLDISRACTIEAWIRPKNEGAIVSRQIVWMWGFSFRTDTGGLLLDALRTNRGPLGTKYQYPADEWTHVVAVMGPCGFRQLYANGKLLAEQKEHVLLIAD